MKTNARAFIPRLKAGVFPRLYHNPRYWYPDNGNLLEFVWDTARNEVRIYAHNVGLYALARDEFQRYGTAVKQLRGRNNFVDTPIFRNEKK